MRTARSPAIRRCTSRARCCRHRAAGAGPAAKDRRAATGSAGVSGTSSGSTRPPARQLDALLAGDRLEQAAHLLVLRSGSRRAARRASRGRPWPWRRSDRGSPGRAAPRLLRARRTGRAARSRRAARQGRRAGGRRSGCPVLRVDHHLLHPADLVQRGRQGLRWLGGMEAEVQRVGKRLCTLSVPLPVMRLRQGAVFVVMDMSKVLCWPAARVGQGSRGRAAPRHRSARLREKRTKGLKSRRHDCAVALCTTVAPHSATNQ